MRVIEVRRTTTNQREGERDDSEGTHHHAYHTQEPCIIASHALLLCNVARKRARSVQAASGPVTMVVVAFVIEESTTPGSSPCECGAWSSGGSGGVASLGDGVGEGDNDSGGVEPAECYADARQHVLVNLTRIMKAAPRPAAGGTGASAR